VLSILLIIMGSIPLISAGFLQIPGSVINGATIFLFGMIAITGLGLAVKADPVYGSKVLIGSTLCAFMLAGLPQLLNLFHINLPEYAAIIMGFPVATGILIAIILTRVFRA
jgi:xanthine/uracil permease